MSNQNFKNVPPTKFDFHQIFKHFENLRIFYNGIRELFYVLFYNVHKEYMFTIEIKDVHWAP